MNYFFIYHASKNTASYHHRHQMEIISINALFEWVTTGTGCISRICTIPRCRGYHTHTDPNVRHVPFDPTELSARRVNRSKILEIETDHRVFVEDIRKIEWAFMLRKYRRYFRSLREGLDDDYRARLMSSRCRITRDDLNYAHSRETNAFETENEIRHAILERERIREAAERESAALRAVFFVALAAADENEPIRLSDFLWVARDALINDN